jgi:hypothetical protein
VVCKAADGPLPALEEAGGSRVFWQPTALTVWRMATECAEACSLRREVISDRIETCAQGQWMDGVVVIGGWQEQYARRPDGHVARQCAASNLRLPAGAPISAVGRRKGKIPNIVSVLENFPRAKIAAGRKDG